ncbi:MAG TPA: amidohydrolase family protein [Segetibacter sp.]|nr:amidohydrolase family protein [Segetibacter sp.]
MNNFKSVTFLCLLALSVFFSGWTERKKSVSGTEYQKSAKENADEQYYSEADFHNVKKFNTHVHISVFDSTFIKQAASDNFGLLTVNVASPSASPIDKQQEVALSLVKAFPENILYATTFSVDSFNAEDWQQKTFDYLKASFQKGAIAVKVWKNIGMELKDRNGKFVMIDNPAFDPIIDFIQKNNITLIGHLGEPRNAWLPVDQMTVSGDKNYFAAHPQYHMYLHPEYPSYEDQVNARDHMLEKHPNIRFVGAHLGSLEWNVDELAKRLDKFPNMAVDMAERISHFQYQAVTNWQKVHDFFIKYQDRLIYATDEGVRANSNPAEVSKSAHENWLRHWKFFTSREKMKVPKVEKEFNGLKLPKEIVDKIYLKNAEKWFPPITKITKG